MPSDVATAQPGKAYSTLAACLQRPLSRGSVHILSSDPLTKPIVDPELLSAEPDLSVLLAGLRFCRKVASTTAMQSIVAKEVSPGPEVESDEDLKSFIRRNLNPVYHPIGTAAMLPQEIGGVVDGELKVYGVDNLRIVRPSFAFSN